MVLPELQVAIPATQDSTAGAHSPEMGHTAFPSWKQKTSTLLRMAVKLLPDLFASCLCFYFHSFSTGVWEWVGSSLPTHHSPDISHSHNLNEEKCRLTRSCWSLQASLGGSWCVEKQNPDQLQELTHSDISVFY